MKKNHYLISLALCVLVFVAACKSKKDVQIIENRISDGTWMVETMFGDTINSVDFMRGSPSIIFTDSTSFSGSTGCNQYSAKYTKTDTGVSIKIGPMTKMACPGKTEGEFVKALSATNLIKTEGRIMRFYNDDKELLSFKKVQ